MTVHLLKKLWADECGAVIATEYLMLGTLVAVGSATGLASMRDSMNAECQEFGNTVREVRQQNTPAAYQKGAKPTYQHAEVADEFVPLSSYGTTP
jgi:Flp pilus assembly pilin Flp